MSANRPGRKVSGHTPARIAAQQRDLITGAQLRATGLSDSAITKRVARGELRRVYRGIYTVSAAPLSKEAQYLAAVLACGPGSAVSHFAAGTLYRVSRFRSGLIDVVSPRRRSLDGVRVHHSRTFTRDEMTTLQGIPVTTFQRLIVDLADVLTPFQLANVLHVAAFRGHRIELPRAPGRHNAKTLAKAFELHASGSAGTRSTAEDTFLRLPLPEPVVNVVFLGFEVDFRWPEQLLAVEVDGPPHGRPYSRNADARRDEALRSAGYDVIRFSADDVNQRQAHVTRTVADALSVRTPAYLPRLVHTARSPKAEVR